MNKNKKIATWTTLGLFVGILMTIIWSYMIFKGPPGDISKILYDRCNLIDKSNIDIDENEYYFLTEKTSDGKIVFIREENYELKATFDSNNELIDTSIYNLRRYPLLGILSMTILVASSISIIIL